MIKKFCDKCKKETSIQEIVCIGASIVDAEDRSYVKKSIDLCDTCRTEIKEVIYQWLYN